MKKEANDSAMMAAYKEEYARSIDDPNAFWGDIGRRMTWIKPYTLVQNTSFEPGATSIQWYSDGTLNACYNCVDRHLKTHPQKTALIFENDDGSHGQRYTYAQQYQASLLIEQIIGITS